jgi:hypothetical protein
MAFKRYGGLLAMLLLGACSASEETHHTVDYYRAHVTERSALLKECANDPGSLKSTPACTNAREAARIEDVGRLRNLAPMGLPTNPGNKTDISR